MLHYLDAIISVSLFIYDGIGAHPFERFESWGYSSKVVLFFILIYYLFYIGYQWHVLIDFLGRSLKKKCKC